MEWPVVVGVVILVLLLAISPLIWLFARRRWLSLSTSLFDCCLLPAGSDQWILGACRYRDDHLEWFRIFSLSLRPHLAIVRRDAQALGTRDPEPSEEAMLYEGNRIVRIRVGQEECELALDPENLTGLLSWLEAAPPGAVRL